MKATRFKHRNVFPKSYTTLLASLLLLTSFATSVLHQESSAKTTSDSGTQPVSTATLEGRLAVFDDAWQTIHDRYYDPTFGGVDWNKQREVFRPQAAGAANSQELYAVLRHLIGPLNDVHTRVYAPEEKFDWWKPRFVGVGISVREVDGLPTVVQVEKNSAPERAGIRPGDVIESIDGTPALSLIDRRLVQQPTLVQNAPYRFRAFASVLEGAAQTSLDLRWRTKTGQMGHAKFERTWRGRQLGLFIHREKGKYVVAQIDAFTPTLALDFTRGIKRQLPHARGLVLDLRGNGGGEAEAMADVASTFLGDGVGLGTFTDRWGISFSINTRAKSLLAAEPLTQTTLPLVVLVSERTSSAAEIFVAALAVSHRATIIGTETCGCVLAIRNQHTLPDGGMLDVSEMDYRTNGGVRLQENGIKPDEVVITRREDLYAHRDPALSRAFQKLAKTR